LTGLDYEVKLFLSNEKPVQEFLSHIYSIIDEVVLNYIARGFKSLMVSFGCTGGQHRSVYSAEQLANHLIGKYKIPIEVHHTKLRIDKKFNQPSLL